MVDLATFEAYKENRKPHWYWCGTKVHYTSAAQALRTVRHAREFAELKARFEKAGGYECNEDETDIPWALKQPGRMRLVRCYDPYMSFDDLAGDTYNAEVNPDVPKHVMDKERKAFETRIDQDGVWGYKGQVWDGDEWTETDSCWGFVGDDFDGSGYDGDFYDSMLDGLAVCLDEEARAYEATRPDMYGVAA